MRVAALGAAAWALLFAPVARADGLEKFEQARQAYMNQSYETAVDRFEELVGGEVSQLRDGPLVLESRKYLAAAYLFLGRREAAEKQFALLLREDADYRLDRAAFPSEVHEVFDAVRARLEQERRERERARQQQEEQRRRRAAERLLRAQDRMEELRAVAKSETVERENSRWIAAIPFGVGQFQNGHERLGLTLAVTEGLLAAISIGTAIAHRTLRDDANHDLMEPDRELAERAERALRVSNWTATGLLAVVAAIGIFDAQLRFRPVVRTTRERTLPAHLRDPLELDPEGLLEGSRDGGAGGGHSGRRSSLPKTSVEVSLGLTGGRLRVRF